MPHLKKISRHMLEGPLSGLIDEHALAGIGPGGLNYIFTKIAIAYVRENGLGYASISEVSSAFNCAHAEFYRRLAAPYEDQKIAENGDIDGYGQETP